MTVRFLSLALISHWDVSFFVIISLKKLAQLNPYTTLFYTLLSGELGNHLPKL
jgi:hypothetical protein